MKAFLKVAFLVVLILLSIALLFVGYGYSMYKEAIENISLEEKVEQIQEKENYTELSELPQIYLDAVISVEDHRFYQHPGIDMIAIGRAFINDIKAMSYVEGGSTITQQLAKNIYSTQEKKMTRKIAEMFMASRLEKSISSRMARNLFNR